MIEQVDIERLKEIFVTRKECQDNTQGIENRLSKDLVRLAVIENQLKYKEQKCFLKMEEIF